MPVVTVKMAKGRSLEVKRRLVAELTMVIADVLDVKPEWVTVLLEEYDRENWASGGSLHIDQFGEGYGRRGS
jgi:4-oxalocrotonate tautomerase